MSTKSFDMLLLQSPMRRRLLTKLGNALLAGLAATVAVSTSVVADETAKPEASRTVIVPYDPQKPAADQKPDRLYLPYEEFLTLWQAAKEHRRGEHGPESASVDQAITSARYEGRVDEHAVTFHARLDLLTGGSDDWKKVALPFRGARLTSVTLDGKAAALEADTLVVEKPGRHAVEADFDVPLAAGSNGFRLGIPRSAATLVSLRLMQPGMAATIAPGSGSVEHLVDGVKEIVAAVGTTAEVRVNLFSAVAAARTSEPAEARIRSEVRIDAAAEETNNSVSFSLPGMKQNHFSVSFESGLDLVDLSVPDLQSWKLREDAGRQVLEFELGTPAENKLDIGFTVRRAVRGNPAEGHVPEISAGAKHVEIVATGLFSRAGEELTVSPGAGRRQIGWPDKVANDWRLAAAFAGDGPLPWHLAPAITKREAKIQYLYQVNRRQIELFASLQLQAGDADLYNVEISLPQGFLVQAVRGERLQDWWRDDDHLHVRFHGETPSVTSLVLYLVRQEKTAPASLDVRPLTLDGFKKITGEAVIAGFKGVDVKMDLTGGAREVAAENAAADYQVVPPLERKRGFTFTEQNFDAKVSLTPAPAKLLTLWTMDAQAHEGWTALGGKVRISLRQGSVDHVRFALPATLPEVRVSGGDVRETRSAVQGADRVYDVQFQSDVYESVEFAFETEVPSAGEWNLPALTFPDAQRSTGYVMVDNASEGEMKIESSGVDTAPPAEVPWLPDLSRNARIFRVQPGWSVKVAIERLEKASGRAAFCAWAELTTALRGDGTEWHRAVWHLQNRTLQYLPVQLPYGAELMSALVAGQSVRPDLARVGEHDAILVPLIKTKPGELSYNVEMIYRVASPTLGWRTGRKFNDPELLGITVEQTFWNVWLPRGWDFGHFDGNMQPVIGEVSETAKLEGAMEELKKLREIASSSTVDEQSRMLALGNCIRLEKDIENTVNSKSVTNNSRVYMSRATNYKADTANAFNVSKKDAESQSNWTLNKFQELNGELAKQKSELATAQSDAQKANGLAVTKGMYAYGGFQGKDQKSQQPQQKQVGKKVWNWQENSGAASQGGVAAPNASIASMPVGSSAAGAGGEQRLYLNDNVVLKQKAQAEAAPAKSAKSLNGPDHDSFTNEDKWSANDGLQFKDLAKERSKSEEKGGRGEKPAAEPQQQQAAVLNTARGNRVAQLDSDAKVPAPASKPEQPAAPMTPLPAQRSIVNREIERRIDGVDDRAKDRAQFGDVAAAAAPAAAGQQPTAAEVTAGNAAQAARDALQPEGRLSLALEFPTEGEVLHFKKVKGNAALEITVLRHGAFDRWKTAGKFAVAALLIWLSGKWMDQRRARRAARVHHASAPQPAMS